MHVLIELGALWTALQFALQRLRSTPLDVAMLRNFYFLCSGGYVETGSAGEGTGRMNSSATRLPVCARAPRAMQRGGWLWSPTVAAVGRCLLRALVSCAQVCRRTRRRRDETTTCESRQSTTDKSNDSSS